MIVVELSGGIGNQMFQYACGKKLALLNKTDLVLDKSSFRKDPLRKFELDIFNIDSKIVGFFGKKMLLFKAHLDNQSFKVINQADRFFDSTIFSYNGNIILRGYWQSEKYFKDIRNILRNDFSLDIAFSKTNMCLLDKIKRSNSVGVHVRREDFVSNKIANSVHGTCTIDYYMRAIKEIVKKISSPIFFVFSDDPSWCEENIKINGKINYVGLKKKNKTEEDFFLMLNCKHFIVANSSFSWWAAWLSNDPKKVIFAPKKWLKKGNDGDIVPKKWLRIK